MQGAAQFHDGKKRRQRWIITQVFSSPRFDRPRLPAAHIIHIAMIQ